LDTPNNKAPLCCEETFGPILSVYEVDSVECATKWIKARPKPLAAYFYGDVKGEAKTYFLRHCSSGGVSINDCCAHDANMDLPFGGVGFSGTG